MKSWIKANLILFCFIPYIVLSAELSAIHVEKKEERYVLHIEARINAPVDKVKQIVTDYENLPSINPYLKESKVVQADGKSTTVNMLTEVCVLFICYKIRDTQTFRFISPDVLYSRVIPNKSDFKFGWNKWVIKESASSGNKQITQLTLDGEVIPNFFILPIIGPYHLKNMIREIATVTINNLEFTAQNK